jgi:serine/threonine protein phosphatase PrpC
MHCPSCNTPNRDDAKFCKGCGRSFSASQPAEDAGSVFRQPNNQTDSVLAYGSGSREGMINRVPTSSDAAQSAPTAPISIPEDHEPASPVSIQEDKQYVPMQDMQDKTQLAPVQDGASTSEASVEEDPSLAPTLVLTPERMVAYHQRRWQSGQVGQSGFEQGTENAPAAGAINRAPKVGIDDAPTASASSPSEHVQKIAEMPTVSMPQSDENEAIPIPPPPPPTMENHAEEGAETPQPPDTVYGGAYPDMEKSETMQQPLEQPLAGQPEQAEQTEQTEQAEQAGPPEQTTPSGDFPVMPVGTTLQSRYEITQVISDSPQEHEYQVIDHQGYQRCWNCGSQQNAHGDEFCIDCGASLLDVPYIMHEYSAQESQEDSHVLQGNIANTFVEQGHTYVIEQVPAQQSAFPNGVQLVAASYSDAGNVRRSEPNEDSTLVLELQRVHESFSAPVGIFIVADGLGGHDNGQVASRMTINVIAERMTRELLAAPLTAEKDGQPAKPFDEDALVTLLHGSIEDANVILCQKNAQDKTDMGSTITGFMVVGEHAYIINVGDSRTYMIRGKQLYQLTTDHSLVGQLVASGLIEPDDVYTHPQRSQIFRSLGDKPNTQIDIFKQQLHPGDILLSCSDGLWEMVRDPQIESTLNSAPDPQTACMQLIDMANANGGEDNISAVVVLVR